jgi:putative toxin-antitoxin system antitoxin component (TIGR02293 family)
MANTPVTLRRSVFQYYPLSNDLKMAEMVSVGLPSIILRSLAEAFGLKPVGMAPIVNISGKTILRRVAAKGKLKPDESERVARLMRVYVRAVEVLEDEDKAKGWLARPLRVLGGKTPLALMASEQGAREVEQVLGRLEHGVFA